MGQGTTIQANVFTFTLHVRFLSQPQDNSTPEIVRFIDLIMEPEYTKVGRIEHFYSKASVAVVEVLAPLRKGDKILIRGSTTNLSQEVESMEVEHKQVVDAQIGQRVGLKVAGRVRENDIVYKLA